MRLLSLASLLIASCTVSAKLTSKRVLEMNEKGKIVGERDFFFETSTSTPPAMPTIPMMTDKAIKSALAVEFPIGSPNITVSLPWIKQTSLCTDKDTNLVHHFEDTLFVPTNDVCSLTTGIYTWIATEDYEVSFGKFQNDFEFKTKHANLAMTRTGFVAGEILVLEPTLDSRGGIFWNLNSGTYSIPISEAQNPAAPTAYLEAIMFPKMKRVFDLLPCKNKLKYMDAEYFPESLPSVYNIMDLCKNNYYIMNENSLTWFTAPNVNVSVCDEWNNFTCANRGFKEEM